MRVDGNDLRIAASANDIPALWAEFADDGLWLQPVHASVGSKKAPCWPQNPNEAYDFGDDQGVCYQVQAQGLALHKKLFIVTRHGSNLLVTFPRAYVNGFDTLTRNLSTAGGQAALISGYEVLMAPTVSEPQIQQPVQFTLTGMKPDAVTHLICDLSGCSLGAMRAVDKQVAAG